MSPVHTKSAVQQTPYVSLPYILVFIHHMLVFILAYRRPVSLILGKPLCHRPTKFTDILHLEGETLNPFTVRQCV